MHCTHRAWLGAFAIVTVMTLTATAQGLTGALVGTVQDEHGGMLPGAVVRVTSPAVIGGQVADSDG